MGESQQKPDGGDIRESYSARLNLRVLDRQGTILRITGFVIMIITMAPPWVADGMTPGEDWGILPGISPDKVKLTPYSDG